MTRMFAILFFVTLSLSLAIATCPDSYNDIEFDSISLFQLDSITVTAKFVVITENDFLIFDDHRFVGVFTTPSNKDNVIILNRSHKDYYRSFSSFSTITGKRIETLNMT